MRYTAPPKSDLRPGRSTHGASPRHSDDLPKPSLAPFVLPPTLLRPMRRPALSRLTPMRAVRDNRPCRFALLASLGACSALAQTAAPTPNILPAEIVTASRLPQSIDHVASTVHVAAGDLLRSAPTVTLDQALRSLPAFTLFRRSDSLTANPTAQGVSLRGLGPSGASRSLVLLDGVPLNDPFGGWVAWTKISRDHLSSVEIVPGGGATAWGNAALGGVVQLFSGPPLPRSASTTVTVGDYGTRSAEIFGRVAAGKTTLDLSARTFGTDGFSLVAPERRGPIDLAAWSRHRVLTAHWRQELPQEVTLDATARGYEEKRGNGTPYQRNGSREHFASLKLSGATRTLAWNAIAYVQDQSFASTFSGVNATRTAETPASDQFAVPSTAAGATWSGTWSHAGGAQTSTGLDARFVRGETREHFTFAAGNFTRLRIAGGQQAFAGLFALHERPLMPSLRATFGARIDGWRDTDGHRVESDRVTHALFRDDRYADRDGNDFSPSAGLVWRVDANWRLRANLQRAFRRPTLNELYRPFRVGANVTEANAALRTESVTSAELGAELKLNDLTAGAALFTNDLRDAVGNVTIARGPGTFPIVGFVAAGGVGRQRLNLERTRVRGLELSARWTPPSLPIGLVAGALLNDATVRRTALAPALVGNRVAQVPRFSASLGGTWRATGKLNFTPRLRYIGRQFEDDENQLTLGAVVVADLGVNYTLTRNLSLFLNCENLGHARIETGRSADGIVNIGTPRLVLGGVRGSW